MRAKNGRKMVDLGRAEFAYLFGKETSWGRLESFSTREAGPLGSRIMPHFHANSGLGATSRGSILRHISEMPNERGARDPQ